MRSPIAKFLTEGELEAFRAPPGSTVLFVADSTPMVERVLGALRLHLGQELGLVDESRDEFHWVLDFPLFLKDEDTGQWTFVHHPFTSPAPGHDDLIETDPGAALSQHYDLIWNGWELGSGSIRIHRQEIQERVFRAMGMSDEEARAKFGWFLDALRTGRAAPRWVRPRDRAFRGPPGRRVEHPRGDRLPQDRQRLGSAHRGTRADDAGTAGRAWNQCEDAEGLSPAA